MDSSLSISSEDLLLVEGSIKGGDAGVIPSLSSRSSRFCRIVQAISLTKLKSECAHEVRCSVHSADSSINYISCSFFIVGERV